MAKAMRANRLKANDIRLIFKTATMLFLVVDFKVVYCINARSNERRWHN